MNSLAIKLLNNWFVKKALGVGFKYVYNEAGNKIEEIKRSKDIERYRNNLKDIERN